MVACFLCNPNKDLVYKENEHFFVMLGLGPIVEGYSLIATKKHIKSFFDLKREEFLDYLTFLSEVKKRIVPIFGQVILTEHGRVGLCHNEESDISESHCYHAHHLIFPTGRDIEKYLEGLSFEIIKCKTFIEAYDNVPNDKEYHFYSNLDGTCGVILTNQSIGRQFFRKVVASTEGMLGQVDWNRLPNYELIEKTKKKIKEF